MANPLPGFQAFGAARDALLDAPIAGTQMTTRKIGRGLRDALIDPLASDIQQSNVAIKQVRDQYPTVDALAGIHPAIAAGQVANDVMADQTGGDTGVNALQAVPMLKKVNMLHKGLRVGGYGIDPRATALKNSLLTQGQILGQTGNVE